DARRALAAPPLRVLPTRPTAATARGHDPAHDVALGHDPRQAIAVQHGHRADAPLRHVPRGLAHAETGVDMVGLATGNERTDRLLLHGSSPSAPPSRCRWNRRGPRWLRRYSRRCPRTRSRS